MSNIYGLLGIPDYQADRSFVNTVGQTIVYDAIQEEINRINDELNAAMSIFVEETTEDIKRRFKLPGSGYMQETGRLSPAAVVKQNGGWDVAFPLQDFSDALAMDNISLAYMSIKDLNLHLDTIQQRYINTSRRQILQALFNNTDWSFQDELKGTLVVKPLANGDGTLYPPVLGSDAEDEDTHYLASGYTAANISDTNDPFPTIVSELDEHFGQTMGGDEIVVFHSATHTAKFEALSGFVDVNDRHIAPSASSNTVVGLPATTPGLVRGRHEAGAWSIEWRRMPDDYLLAVYLGATRPLAKRVDEAKTGLPQGLSLVSKNNDYPLEDSRYRLRQGFGVLNRLNCVVMQLTTNGSYTAPAGFTR
jgi:hypothetical protein